VTPKQNTYTKNQIEKRQKANEKTTMDDDNNGL